MTQFLLEEALLIRLESIELAVEIAELEQAEIARSIEEAKAEAFAALGGR